MKKYFFYKKDLKRLKKTNLNEFNIFVKKLIKLKFNKQKFILKINNKVMNKIFCLQTGWKRSVNSLYSLSRMCLKESVRSRSINGLKPISW